MSRDITGVPCSPPCMDALQAEMGSWVALRFPGEMTSALQVMILFVLGLGTMSLVATGISGTKLSLGSG